MAAEGRCGGQSELPGSRADGQPCQGDLAPAMVVRARVPFQSGGGAKVRPAVLLHAASDGWCTVLPVSSAMVPNRRVPSVDVADLAAAGLTRPSVVLLAEATIGRQDVFGSLGRLAPVDRGALAVHGVWEDAEGRRAYLAVLRERAQRILGDITLEELGISEEDLLPS